MTQDIPVEDIRIGAQYHPTRLWTDPVAMKWVEHYRRQIRAGKVLDPIILDPRLFIVDGHRRWASSLVRVQTGKVQYDPCDNQFYGSAAKII